MKDITAHLPTHLQPPMENGEVVFQAPWEGRVFGMAVALHEAGRFPWQAFQERLIAEIGLWERTQDKGNAYPYFELFERALQGLVVAEKLLGEGEVTALAGEFATRPADHDHAHLDDDRDHHHHHD